MARPTDYTPELVEKAKLYIHTIDGVAHVIPTVEGLAIYLGVHRTTLYEWSKEHEEFSYILEEVMSYQAAALINRGLKGEFNSTITKLMLTKHGYTDKTDVTSDGKALPTPILGAVTKDGD